MPNFGKEEEYSAMLDISEVVNLWEDGKIDAETALEKILEITELFTLD